MANLGAACGVGRKRAASIVSALETVEVQMELGDWHGAGLSVGEALRDSRMLTDLLSRMQDAVTREEMGNGNVEGGGG